MAGRGGGDRGRLERLASLPCPAVRTSSAMDRRARWVKLGYKEHMDQDLPNSEEELRELAATVSNCGQRAVEGARKVRLSKKMLS
ncbi:hypothetical protein ACP70R_002907 [Stipagrostis hirtigluma subsp. patula]